METEFHIYASKFDTCFVMRGIGEGYPMQFPSFYEAALHARTQPGCDKGLVVIHDEKAGLVSRIPFVSKRSKHAVNSVKN